MQIPLIIMGAKGASKEAYYIVKDYNVANPGKKYDVLGFVDANELNVGNAVVDGKCIVTCDKNLQEYIRRIFSDDRERQDMAVLIPFGNPKLKKDIYEKLKDIPKVFFPNIIHPSAITEGGNVQANIFVRGNGNIVSPGAVLTADVIMGSFNLIGRCATVGHDVRIGNFNSVFPGAVVSGGVIIEDRCLLGANSTVLQGLKVSTNTTLGAGAVLTKDTEGEETLVGVPAKRIKRNE